MPKGIPKNGTNKGWFKKGIFPYNKGRQFSKEIKKKMSVAMKGNKNVLGKHWKLSEETKKKWNKWRIGKKLSEETKQKISRALIGKKPTIYWLGKKRPAFTEEWKRKMSEGHKGDKNYQWKGGISFEPYTIDWKQDLKRSIRERDHYICQVCKKLQGDVAFCIHHIDYNKKNCDPRNLITLCRSCHSKTNKNREYWINYFKQN
jgi:hypothetical protein